jgi:hypothetical protein
MSKQGYKEKKKSEEIDIDLATLDSLFSKIGTDFVKKMKQKQKYGRP